MLYAGFAQQHCCALLRALREAGPASHSGLCRLRAGELEEEGPQWVCTLCRREEPGRTAVAIKGLPFTGLILAAQLLCYWVLFLQPLCLTLQMYCV